MKIWENKNKLLSQFEHELSYLSTDISMCMLHEDGAEVLVVISDFVAKRHLWKCKCEFCKVLITAGEVDLSEYLYVDHF